jgi:hypothetical protein
LGVIDPKQHDVVHFLGGYQESNGKILADVCEVNERRDTLAALAGFGSPCHGSPNRTRLAVERPSAAARQLGIPAFKYFSGQSTFDRSQVLGDLLQSPCVCTHDTTIGVNDEYRPRKGVQEIRERLAQPAQEGRKTDGANTVADERMISRRRFHAAQVATSIEADLLHLRHISTPRMRLNDSSNRCDGLSAKR